MFAKKDCIVQNFLDRTNEFKKAQSSVRQKN